MSKQKNLSPLVAGAGLALVAAALSAPVHASVDNNPFAMQVLEQGYELGGQLAEGKCGEGKCGGDKAKKEGKCGEGKCGEDKADLEGNCGEDKADMEGNCGEDKAEKEGKCGEGKCGH